MRTTGMILLFSLALLVCSACTLTLDEPSTIDGHGEEIAKVDVDGSSQDDVTAQYDHTPLTTSSEVPRMPLKEAKELYDGASALFLDARFEWEFDKGHIPGAILLEWTAGRSSEQLESSLALLDTELPKDQLIITYCN